MVLWKKFFKYNELEVLKHHFKEDKGPKKMEKSVT